MRQQVIYEWGYSYEAQQPPLTTLDRSDSMDGDPCSRFADLTGTRLAGVIWLDVGLLLLWMACRIALIDPVRCGAAALLIATAPLVIYSGSYVTNDAASILAGSLVLFAAALAWKNPGRSSTVLLLCTGLFVPRSN